LRLRAAAGGALSTALVVGGFCITGFHWTLLLLLTAAGVVASVTSWFVERRQPASWPEARYAVLGLIVGGATLVVLAWPDYGFLLLGALVALPVGASGGAVAGLAAARLPTRLLTPVLCLGVTVLAGVGAVAVVRTLPWLSGSYLVVKGPSTADSAEQLAERIAAGLRAEPDPLSDAAWEKVASSAVTTRPGGQANIGYDRSAIRRQITVWVNGERSCVDVQGNQVASYQGECKAS